MMRPGHTSITKGARQWRRCEARTATQIAGARYARDPPCHSRRRATMENQKQATSQGRHGPDAYRTTARVVGVLYLAGMVVYIEGNVVVQSILGAPDHLATVPAN